MKTKLQSKTIRFQMLMAGLDVLVLAPEFLSPYLSPTTFASVIALLAIANKVGNVYLRTITSEPVK